MDRAFSHNPPNKRPLYTLYTANAVSLIGNHLTTLAIPWFVLVTTGSASKTGITAFFSILPIVIAGIVGGAVVDRLGYKTSSIISDIASGATVASIALLHAVGLLEFWVLLVLVFAGAFLDAPGGTARASLIPELAEMGKVEIERASATIQVVERGSRLIAAPVAGLLIAAVGPVAILWIDAATFAISAAMVAIGVPSAHVLGTVKAASEGYLADLKVGFGFIRTNALIKAVVLTVMVTNFLDAARGSVVLPYYAKNVFDSSVALGLMFGASGGGAVVGALIYAAVGSRFSRRGVFIPAFIIVALPSLILAFLPPLWVVILAQFVMGLAAGPINPILMAVGYERIPATMRGRVFGALTSGSYMAMPAGVLIGGFMLEWIDLRATFIVIGVCYLITTLSLIINPAIHDMDNPRPVPDSEAVITSA